MVDIRKKLKQMTEVVTPKPEVSVLLKTYQSYRSDAERLAALDKQKLVTVELEHVLNLLRVSPMQDHYVKHEENAQYFRSQGFTVSKRDYISMHSPSGWDVSIPIIREEKK